MALKTSGLGLVFPGLGLDLDTVGLVNITAFIYSTHGVFPLQLYGLSYWLEISSLTAILS